MEPLRGTCVIGQSGGPTAVINASVLGAVQAALQSEYITGVLGAAYGITGILQEQFYDLAQEDPAELELLRHTPASALGSCRYKLSDPAVDDTDYRRILEVFRKYDVRYFFYNGGNDSMDTCNKISKYLLQQGYACRVMGIPKTIDNDLFGTDHCPGFASAAKYLSTSLMEVAHDAHVYAKGRITVVECMGRSAGWLAGATALATAAGCGPDLIYLPEVPFDYAACARDAMAIYRRQGHCIIAVSEGIRDAQGTYISEYDTAGAQSTDRFGHVQLGGVAAVLSAMLGRDLQVSVRGIEISLLQRCAAHCASQRDVDEAWLSGHAAVEYALQGHSDYMVGLQRAPGAAYTCTTCLVPLQQAANAEACVPAHFINEAGNFVTDAFLDYVRPLVQGEARPPYEDGLPRFARLKLQRI